MKSEQIEAFVRDGFVRLEGAFPREVAARCRAAVWRGLGLDPERRETLGTPVRRFVAGAESPFCEAYDTPRLRSAFDTLVGAARWKPRVGLGHVVVRFPSEDDPGDTGWHVDGSYEMNDELFVNLYSRSRALLALFLLSDVGDRDAPTRIRVGSHLLVPPVLRPADDVGLPYDAIAKQLPDLARLPLALATGRAGDVFLCHPFLVHAASWPHRGETARFVSQPGLAPAEPLRLERADGAYSPVERAIRLGLGQ